MGVNGFWMMKAGNIVHKIQARKRWHMLMAMTADGDRKAAQALIDEGWWHGSVDEIIQIARLNGH